MKIEYLFGKEKKLYQITYLAKKFRLLNKLNIPLQALVHINIFFKWK